MRAALGRLNAELYPPLEETGLQVRSQGPLPLPPLIDAPRRGGSGGPKGSPAPAPKAAGTPAKGAK
jgi:hypothetical protein